MMGEPLSAIQIGVLGEAAVLHRMAALGVPCYVPYGDGQNSDLICEICGQLIRIQVKTSASKKDTINFLLLSRRKKGWVPYTDIDYFALYSIYHDKVLLIPYRQDRHSVVIRFVGEPNPQYNQLPAEDYEAGKVVEAIVRGLKENQQPVSQ